MSDSLRPLWAIAHHATLFIEFPRQEYWNGLPFPSLSDLSDLGIETESPSLQADSLLSEPPGKPLIPHIYHLLSAICYVTSGRYLAPPDVHPYLTNGHNDTSPADLPVISGLTWIIRPHIYHFYLMWVQQEPWKSADLMLLCQFVRGDPDLVEPNIFLWSDSKLQSWNSAFWEHWITEFKSWNSS